MDTQLCIIFCALCPCAAARDDCGRSVLEMIGAVEGDIIRFQRLTGGVAEHATDPASVAGYDGEGKPEGRPRYHKGTIVAVGHGAAVATCGAWVALALAGAVSGSDSRSQAHVGASFPICNRFSIERTAVKEKNTE